MAEWQPYETAPKDGTMVLVSFGTMGVHAVAWLDRNDDGFAIWCVDDNKHGPYALRGWNYNHPTAPTHWQPLPPPPGVKALTPKPTAWLRYDGMKAMPADEKEAYQQLTDSLSKSIVAEYTIPLYTSGVPPSAAPERVEVGRLVLPATNDEWGEPEIDAFMGRLEALQERIQKGNGRMELAVFVEVPAVGVATVDGGKHG
jgi:hypothetical protein